MDPIQIYLSTGVGVAGVFAVVGWADRWEMMHDFLLDGEQKEDQQMFITALMFTLVKVALGWPYYIWIIIKNILSNEEEPSD